MRSQQRGCADCGAHWCHDRQRLVREYPSKVALDAYFKAFHEGGHRGR